MPPPTLRSSRARSKPHSEPAQGRGGLWGSAALLSFGFAQDEGLAGVEMIRLILDLKCQAGFLGQALDQVTAHSRSRGPDPARCTCIVFNQADGALGDHL